MRKIEIELKAEELKKKLDIKDGKDADEQKILSTLEARLPELLEPIQKQFEELKGETDRLRQALTQRPRAMGRAKVQFQRWIYLTDQVDGATTAFTLPPDVVAVHGLISTQFPQAWNLTDFTFAGRTLTTNFTMQAGQTLIAVCDVLFYP